MIRANRSQLRAYQLNLAGGKEEAAPKRKRTREEAMHQAALMRHRAEMEPRYPSLRYLFSTLNGIFLPPHLRAQAVEAGMAKGILDLWYPVRRVDPTGEIWSGLAMDLKKLHGGRATTEQREWAEHLARQGWRVYFPAGVVEAWRCLCCYEGITGPDHTAPDLVASEEAIRRTCEP